MLAVNVRGMIAWCLIPKQILMHVQSALNVKQTQIHPVALLNKNELKQYYSLQKENIPGRYLEK